MLCGATWVRLKNGTETMCTSPSFKKIYGRSGSGPEWYAGGTVIAAVPKVKTGSPDWSRISTSHIEALQLGYQDAQSALCPQNERDQQTAHEPESRHCPLGCLVQLLPCSSNPSCYSRDGSRDYRSCMVTAGTGWSENKCARKCASLHFFALFLPFHRNIGLCCAYDTQVWTPAV